MKKEHFIKFIDENVDGCGSDIVTFASVYGEDITNGTIERVKNAIDDYKNENEGEWDTDGCLDVAREQLETEGYEVKFLIESACISF